MSDDDTPLLTLWRRAARVGDDGAVLPGDGNAMVHLTPAQLSRLVTTLRMESIQALCVFLDQCRSEYVDGRERLYVEGFTREMLAEWGLSQYRARAALTQLRGLGLLHTVGEVGARTRTYLDGTQMGLPTTTPEGAARFLPRNEGRGREDSAGRGVEITTGDGGWGLDPWPVADAESAARCEAAPDDPGVVSERAGSDGGRAGTSGWSPVDQPGLPVGNSDWLELDQTGPAVDNPGWLGSDQPPTPVDTAGWSPGDQPGHDAAGRDWSPDSQQHPASPVATAPAQPAGRRSAQVSAGGMATGGASATIPSAFARLLSTAPTTSESGRASEQLTTTSGVHPLLHGGVGTQEVRQFFTDPKLEAAVGANRDAVTAALTRLVELTRAADRTGPLLGFLLGADTAACGEAEHVVDTIVDACTATGLAEQGGFWRTRLPALAVRSQMCPGDADLGCAVLLGLLAAATLREPVKAPGGWFGGAVKPDRTWSAPHGSLPRAVLDELAWWRGTPTGFVLDTVESAPPGSARRGRWEQAIVGTPLEGDVEAVLRNRNLQVRLWGATGGDPARPRTGG